MDLSIIVVNWNTRELLRNCLASIYANCPPGQFEVIVVDNASGDESTDMVQTEFPEARLICNEQNVGFARANNQGITYSRGRYILLLNSDTVVKPYALERMVAFMDTHSEAGGAGSMLLNPDGSLQRSCYPFPTIPRELWRLFHLDAIRPYGNYRMSDWDPKNIREVDHIQGASLVLRREALDKVGPLDEDYFMYSEELDLCYRLKKANWKLFWLPQSEVVHLGGQSTRQAAQEMFLELYRSKVLFFRKNHPKAAGWYKGTLLAASLWRLFFSPLVIFVKAEKRQNHMTMLRYYRCLIQELPRM